MTIPNDRIRRVAEKHTELRQKCDNWYHNPHKQFEHGFKDANCRDCLGTLWTPLPVSLWAQVLYRAHWFVEVIYSGALITVNDPNIKVRVLFAWEDKDGQSQCKTASAQADNADDALVMALEQADGVGA